MGLPPDGRSEAPATRKRTVASWRKYDKPSVRKRFTRTGLCRRRVKRTSNAPWPGRLCHLGDRPRPKRPLRASSSYGLKACRAGFVPAGKARLNTGAAGVERVEARDQVSGDTVGRATPGQGHGRRSDAEVGSNGRRVEAVGGDRRACCGCHEDEGRHGYASQRRSAGGRRREAAGLCPACSGVF